MSRTQGELVFGKGAHTDALSCLEGLGAPVAGKKPPGAHLGQVVLLRRLLGAWPPPGGGDTW
jgi:hypothetical protein